MLPPPPPPAGPAAGSQTARGWRMSSHAAYFITSELSGVFDKETSNKLKKHYAILFLNPYEKLFVKKTSTKSPMPVFPRFYVLSRFGVFLSEVGEKN
jgi:hypothetical protein